MATRARWTLGARRAAALVAILAGGGCGDDATGPAEIASDFCHGVADGTRCDDGSPCTVDDRCGLGVCLGQPGEDGPPCDDGDACTAEDACLGGICAGVPADCAELDGPCVTGACDPATGECAASASPDGVACDDGDACTEGDACASGACAGTAVACEPTGTPCVDVACDPASGACVTELASAGTSCDDGDPCTESDMCAAGACAGAARVCPAAGDGCQLGVCDPETGACGLEAAADGGACDDGDPCTAEDACSGGECAGVPACVCEGQPDGATCDDGDPCTTGDACGAGLCAGTPVVCDGGPACQAGACEAEGGECVWTPLPDGAACDDGDLCTEAAACQLGVCVGVPVACDGEGDACNESACDPATGACVPVPAGEGAPCDDGLACTVYDACSAGTCAGAPADCSTLAGTCELALCDESAGGCVVTAAPAGAPCDDGDTCTGQDACQDGACVGGSDLCAACEGKVAGQACDDGDPCTSWTVCEPDGDLLPCVGEPKDCGWAGGDCMVGICDVLTGACSAVPATPGTPCDDGDACTGDDGCDGDGGCASEPVDCSAMDGACQIGVCQEDTGACQVKLFDDGIVCDDTNPCSIADHCEAGVCIGTLAEDGEACSDEDPCTEGDACLAGVCGGAAKDCSEAGGLCLVGVCDGASGACVAAPVPDGVACDDLDVCTLETACVAGACAAGIDQCACEEQPDGSSCDDGLACTEDDTCYGGGCIGEPVDCSGLDGGCQVGSCDPTTGACELIDAPDGAPCDDLDLCTAGDVCLDGFCMSDPVDCSGLDGGCEVGACDPGSGACVAAPGPDGEPCDDGVACTGPGVCAAGVCEGGADLCGSCSGQAVGAPCDDEDPCTVGEGTCQPSGELLVCAAAPIDCSELDGACVEGVCSEGECEAAPRPDGTACDDADPCTGGDACVGGACTSAPIDTCGEAITACEPPAANDSMAGAIALAAGDGSAQVLGWIDPAGESDWYAISLAAGQLLVAETRAVCGSALDTQLAVWAADATAPFATADDGGEAGWSVLPEVEIDEDGTYYVAVTALASSGAGAYLLDVAGAWPPPCEDDAACECEQLVCQEGACVPGMGLEVEPNDVAAEATPVALGDEVLAAFEAAGDVDWFRVALEVGVPVNLVTAPFCGATTDPAIALYDASGVDLLWADQDTAGGGHAALEGLEAPADGDYLVRVHDEVLTSGAAAQYVLRVEDARCTEDAECPCEDAVCGGSPGSPGVCVPANPADPAVTPWPLALGQRVHGEIATPYEVDAYSVALGAGTYDLETLSFCGSDTDTELTLLGPGGETVASDEDGGDGFFAALAGLTIAEPGTYTLEVRAYGPGMGEYIVRAQEAAAP